MGSKKECACGRRRSACVIDRVLLRQEADKDPRPIDPAVVATQVEHLSAAQSCRAIVR